MPYRTPTQKLTGDPGIFGTLGKIFTTVAKVGVGLLPGPIGMAARGAVGLLTPAQQAGRTPAFTPPVVPGGSRPLITFDGGRPGVQTPLGTRGGGPLSGVAPKRRRMDPMNVKALRRATRRLAAFDREKKKVEKQLRLIAPRPTRRSRRDVPPGHGHVR